MNVDDLYPMWVGQARDELHEHVDRMQRGYDRLVHKDSTYGRSIKAMLDLRIRLLATCDAAPRQLDATQPPQDERGQGRVIRSQSCRVCEGIGQWHDNEGDNDDYCNACNGTGVEPVALSTLTEVEKRKLIGNYFAEAWAKEAAWNMLDDYDRRPLAASAPAQQSESLRMEEDAVDALFEDGWVWDGDQWQRPPEQAKATTPQPVAAEVTESVAKAIYQQWRDLLGFKPWEERGNSQMQDKARDLARAALSGTGSDESKKGEA